MKLIKLDSVKVAILDMYADKIGQQGIRCINDILHNIEQNISIEYFNVRSMSEIPDMSFDLYISTGGPGNPLEYNIKWSEKYFKFIDEIFEWNANKENKPKYLFAICHSFQILCAYKSIGSIAKRERFSLGITAVKKTSAGKADSALSGLADVFYAADHRYFQVINPDLVKLQTNGYEILALEETGQDKNVQRSIMAVRFDPFIIGTQFHPEADIFGMQQLLLDSELTTEMQRVLGTNSLQQMKNDVEDPQKLLRTHQSLLPNFIKSCMEANLVQNSYEFNSLT